MGFWTWRRYKWFVVSVVAIEFGIAAFYHNFGSFVGIGFGVVIAALNLVWRKEIKKGFEEDQAESVRCLHCGSGNGDYSKCDDSCDAAGDVREADNENRSQ